MDGLLGHYAKWDKSDPERQVLSDILYVESKNAKIIKRENKMLVTRCRG